MQQHMRIIILHLADVAVVVVLRVQAAEAGAAACCYYLKTPSRHVSKTSCDVTRSFLYGYTS